jgi:hypothetical protein
MYNKNKNYLNLSLLTTSFYFNFYFSSRRIHGKLEIDEVSTILGINFIYISKVGDLQIYKVDTVFTRKNESRVT